MKNIPVNDDQYQKLAEQANATGFADVTAFVVALAADAAFDTSFGMSEAELRQSAAECDTALADLKQNGGGRDAREALLGLGQELGFPPPG